MTLIINKIMDYLARSLPDMYKIIFSLLLSIFIAIIISQMYKYTHRGLNFELSFMTTLVLLAPIVTSVMLFIRGDLVLSLGLIGSISIVRFRTPIKDTRDMVFLFWVITVGLGCGTYNWIIVIMTTIFVSVIMVVLHITKYGLSQSNDFVMVISGIDNLAVQDIDDVIGRYTHNARIRSQEIDDDLWEIVYELRFEKLSKEATENIVKDIRSIGSVKKVSLLAPQIGLPV